MNREKISDTNTEMKDAKIPGEPVASKNTTITKPIEPQIKKNTRGIVVDCALLYVRLTPDKRGIVKAIIPKGTKVGIHETESDDMFYSISIADGTTGFCMKQFIKVY